MDGRLVYIASPYTVVDTEGLTELDVSARLNMRWAEVTDYAVKLSNDGIFFFAPITMSHPITEAGGATGWDYWIKLDEKFMFLCTECHVLMSEGWQTSRGVKHEVAWFLAHDKPVYYVNAASHEVELSHNDAVKLQEV